MDGNLQLPRRKLARIRCLQLCIDNFKHCKPLPECLCYVPAEIRLKCTTANKIPVYPSKSTTDKKRGELAGGIGSIVLASGEEYCNSQGQWVEVLKCEPSTSSVESKQVQTFEKNSWVLLYNNQSSDETPCLTTIEEEDTLTNKELVFGKKSHAIRSWEKLVEATHSLHSKETTNVAPPHEEAIVRLQSLPPNWNLEFDEELAKFLCVHREATNENLGSIKNYVESVDVSSFCDDDRGCNMTDDDSETYWESDGNTGQHWIRLKMKKGTIVKKLFLTLDGSDDNYLPSHVVVMGGELDNLQKLSDVQLQVNYTEIKDVCVLEDMTQHYPYLEIRIKQCKDDGIDTRIHGIKIKSSKERDLGLSEDLFKAQELVRFPKLEGFSSEILYRRSLCLFRFIDLLDSVIHLIVPGWEYSIGSYKSLQVIKQLLTLSNKRNALISTLCRESESGRPDRVPKLYIDRRAASEHKSNPEKDQEYKNSVFMQIYEGLKPRDKHEKSLDYRWSTRWDQWWECKFLQEGIIDQGGGFRDSLSDLADELCPMDQDTPVPLPFFIRAPNQSHEDANVNRDVYIPNPACNEFVKYHWIGQLMGACLRGKENLVISLPSFIWKQMIGESVSWTRDLHTVDAAEVKLIENMETMDKESYNAHFDERTWTTTLSDGRVITLHGHNSDLVQYEDRLEYCKCVKETRMKECSRQVEAIRGGLLSVVPQAVFDLMTWQEVENQVCGDPEISVEALKRTIHYEDLDQSDTRVKYLWDALSNFSNEDRSRFLRFVTGRRRLPAPLYICPDKGDNSQDLPESSTCSNTLYWPNYSSAKIAEEKLRYAAYNCIAIDTDCNVNE